MRNKAKDTHCFLFRCWINSADLIGIKYNESKYQLHLYSKIILPLGIRRKRIISGAIRSGVQHLIQLLTAEVV